MNEEKITTSANKKLSPEEIKRVKGLGCLQDKRYDDIRRISMPRSARQTPGWTRQKHWCARISWRPFPHC